MTAFLEQDNFLVGLLYALLIMCNHFNIFEQKKVIDIMCGSHIHSR